LSSMAFLLALTPTSLLHRSLIITDVNADVANTSQFLWRRYGVWHYGGVDFPRQLLHLEGRKTKAIDCK
jgi:hypothetical protein